MRTRIVVAGMSWRSTAFLGELATRDDCEVVALCDPYPSRIAQMAGRYALAGARRHGSFGEFLESGAGADAVMVFTPDHAHAEVAVPALERGMHVFVEKPLEVTAERCAALVEADRRAGGRTYVGHNLRHAPLYKAVKALLDAGELGEILTLQADEFYDGGRTYFRRWNRLKRLSGGLWVTKACHDFDLLHWFAGAPPLAVSAFSALSHYRPRPDAAAHCGDCPRRKGCPDAFDPDKLDPEQWRHLQAAVADGMPRPDLCLFNSDKDTFDHGTAALSFPGGVVASYTVNVVSGFTNRRIRIAGTKAALDGDLERQELTLLRRDPSGVERRSVADPATAGGHGGADSSIVADFLAFARGETPPAVAPDEAATAVRIGLAAEQSCLTGQTVKLAN